MAVVLRRFESGIDRTVFHGGKASAYVRMNGAGQADFGTLMQMIQAEPYHGRRVRLSAYVKTENAGEGAALWMRVDGMDTTLAFDNMDARRIRGTKDWQRTPRHRHAFVPAGWGGTDSDRPGPSG